MNNIPTPQFLLGTMSWIAYGYFYGAQIPEGFGSNSSSSDPWQLFVNTLESCKSGHYKSLNKLTQFLLPPVDENLSEACFALMADAGSVNEREFIARALQEGPLDVLPIAADAAGASGNLALVPLMRDAWRRVADRRQHLRIGLAIARLMEPPGGAIAALAEKFTPDPAERERLIKRGGRYAELAQQHGEQTNDFEQAVNDRYNELSGRFARDIYLWRGQPFNLREMIEEMYQHVTGPQAGMLGGLFIPMRRKVEATTGWNMSPCFNQGIFNPLGAAAVLDDIVENVSIDHFEIGRKYFFGRRIE
ncbi:hypothetical protein NKJ55_28425 [Mesorhizobium sp. M0106]|uniref:hypothetical protein n=1 Tax=Mesorhizobium sp. M0106 TaxID=2956880 RepID=UPI00333D4FD2